MNKKWNKILCSFAELNLDITLSGGQSFRWHKNNSEWQGVLAGLVWSLKQDSQGNLLYVVHNPADKKCKSSLKRPKQMKLTGVAKYRASQQPDRNMLEDTKYYESILNDYFQFHICLKEQYALWCAVDHHFEKISKDYTGIRILRQEPLENLMSFICSSNNNISRITSMVDKLCSNFGKEIWCEEEKKFFTFPTLESLAHNGVEGKLRELAFGYRAKYIHQSANFLLSHHPPGWLESLRRLPYKEAHAALLQLPGVGAKVADCICLMSLDKLEAVPIDTHIWQVTKRDYMHELNKTKSMTNQIYLQIGDFYRKRFGEHAGWANTVLFASDLKQFKTVTKS